MGTTTTRWWLTQWLTDWLWIVGSFGLVAMVPHPFTYGTALLVLGTRQLALGALGHEAVHGLVCRPRWLNDLLGQICLLPLGLALPGWRKFHLAHHRWIGSSADPELPLKRLGGQYDLPFRWRNLIAWTLADLCGLGILSHPVWIFMVSPGTPIPTLVSILLIHGAFVALCVWLQVLWIPAVWYAAMMSTFWACIRLRAWTEHCEAERETSRITPTWWQRWLFLPHDSWYHYEHHLRPGLPARALRNYRVPGDSSHTVGELFRALSRQRDMRH